MHLTNVTPLAAISTCQRSRVAARVSRADHDAAPRRAAARTASSAEMSNAERRHRQHDGRAASGDQLLPASPTELPAPHASPRRPWACRWSPRCRSRRRDAAGRGASAGAEAGCRAIASASASSRTRCTPAPQPVHQSRLRQQHRRARILQHVRQPVRRIRRVERQIRAARLEDAEHARPPSRASARRTDPPRTSGPTPSARRWCASWFARRSRSR